MYNTPSCTTSCCANICQRTYGVDRRNISMARSTLGPFPDEWLLSGLDKILYFCGIKNMRELVDKFPISSDFYLSSSSSDSDVGITWSCQNLLNECSRRTADCIIKESCSNNKLGKAKSVDGCQFKQETETPKCSDRKNIVDTTNLTKSLKRSKSECGKTPSVCVRSASNSEASKCAKKSTSIAVICEKGSYSQPVLLCHKVEKKAAPLPACSELKLASLFTKKSEKPSRCCQVTVDKVRSKNMAQLQVRKLPRIVGTKWAMARINIFSDCSRTYEILEIKGRLPTAVIPCRTVVFFAVLPDGSTICYDYVKDTKKC